MIAIASLLWAFAGFAALAAAMDRHEEQLGTAAFAATQRHGWQAGGSVLLLLSLLACLQRWNASVGIAAWLGLLTLAAMAWGLVLTYAPERARRLALAAAALGAVAAALAY
ncbi:DUF3325 family protein [Comamonas sp. JUb58]|uniref:DUF3325 family protein n=1 Tax=Comamonas sp. JUb58 TaxID=2485114 RepID=UPI00105B871F|nr:DUF3325 family protein [Comamonas sp. JUb58]TDS78766.1 uncharacterized protein DUF3325 [Comamonas sp. JUb58]